MAKKRRPSAAQKRVFGFDVQLDDQGHPIEQGIGSKSNQTLEHLRALCTAEPDNTDARLMYDAALEKRLAAGNTPAEDEDEDDL